MFSHVQQRVEVWIDPYAYRSTSGYQIVQSLYSLADGNIFGTGIGRGLSENIIYIESDLIFVSMAEELGLLGASGILLLFMLFTVRGLAIAARARSDVDAFCATGLTTAIALQAFLIIGGVTKLIPLTGVTLPFMAQGGSSLLASFIIVGLLLRAGDSGTGHEQEMQGVTTYEGGILGRVTLGRRLTLLITGFTLLFAALIGNLTWHMVFNAENVREDPANNHTIERNTNIQRGAIVTSDNVVLAKSELGEDEQWNRTYPQGTLASHLVGYISPRFGAAGVESTYADTLAGRTDVSTWSGALDILADKKVPGNDVYLTIDSRIQAAAEQALNGYVGGAVVLDATTGAVLAEASAPTYDNNGIEEMLEQSGTGENDGKQSVLFNRATQGLYAPGSTFKTVTLTGALANATTSLDKNYDSPPSINIGTNIQGNPGEITNYGGYGYGNVTLERGFAVSSNTVFAQVADELGAEKLCATAAGFGFNRELDSDFSLNTSLMPKPEEMTQWETAWAGVGQPVGYHESPSGPQATVMQMAMVGAGIANNGTLMKPHLLDHVIGSDGAILRTNSPVVLGEATTPETARKVQQAMEGVVRGGTGTAAQISGYTVRGKTGTAETGKPEDNAWFVGYVEIGERKVVVAIVLEEVSDGAATPKARDILQAAIGAYNA
jgi:peptidoglycan glycosyltransferase